MHVHHTCSAMFPFPGFRDVSLSRCVLETDTSNLSSWVPDGGGCVKTRHDTSLNHHRQKGGRSGRPSSCRMMVSASLDILVWVFGGVPSSASIIHLQLHPETVLLSQYPVTVLRASLVSTAFVTSLLPDMPLHLCSRSRLDAHLLGAVFGAPFQV